MNVLSESLREKISIRPTNTTLRSKYTKQQENAHKKSLKTVYIIDDKVDVPRLFDGRIVWDGLLNPSVDQGSCGSCWAFASTGTLADKFNIQSMGLMNIKLSATRLILCDLKGDQFKIPHPELNLEEVALQQSYSNKTSACFGNTLASAWVYLFIIGTNTEECVPYNKKYGEYKFDNFWYWLNYTPGYGEFYGHIYDNLYYIGLEGNRITKQNNIKKRLQYLNKRRKEFKNM